MMNLNNNEKMIVNAVIESYISVMGAAKWNSMTAEQQHDVIMTIVKDFGKAVGA